MCVPKKVFLALVVFAEKEEIEVGNGKPFYILGFAYAYAWGGREREGVWRFLVSFSSDLRKNKRRGFM